MTSRPRHSPIPPSLLGLVAGALCACSGGSSGGNPTKASPFVLFENERRLNTSPAGTSDSELPRVVVTGERVYAAWLDQRGPEAAIYMRRSDDGGKTWSKSDSLVPGSEDAEWIDDEATLACEGERVAVGWIEDAASSLEDAFVNVSADGGLTWLAQPVRLDGDAPGAATSENLVLAISGSNLYAVWEDTRSGLADVWFNRSVDGGETWEGDVRLDVATAPGDRRSLLPRIALDGDNVCVFWLENVLGNARDDVRLSASTDGGATWTVEDVSVPASTEGDHDAESPRVVVDGDRISVLWIDDRDNAVAGRVLLANRSTDGGQTWLPQDVRVDGATSGNGVGGMRLEKTDSGLVAAWEDLRSGIQLWRNTSFDGGAVWEGEAEITDTPGDIDALVSAAEGEEVFLAFEDDKDGEDDIYVMWSLDAGITWTEPLRIDGGDPGAGDSDSPEIDYSGGSVWVAWHDERDGGDLDIYANGGELVLDEGNEEE